jgi:hypothetical protein
MKFLLAGTQYSEYDSAMRTSRTFRWTLTIVLTSATAFFAVIGIQSLPPADRWPHPTKWLCPVLAWLRPTPHTPIQANDWLQLEALGDKQPRELTVRLYGDGRVERDIIITTPFDTSMGCPLHESDKHLQIPAEQARAILSKARDGGFCRLCQIYQSSHDNPSGGYTQLSFSLAGKTKQAMDASGNPPPLYGTLVDSITDLSPAFPTYATATVRSPERIAECRQFEQEQMTKLMTRLGVRPAPPQAKTVR